jgi:hypothetical protein
MAYRYAIPAVTTRRHTYQYAITAETTKGQTYHGTITAQLTVTQMVKQGLQSLTAPKGKIYGFFKISDGKKHAIFVAANKEWSIARYAR